VRFSRTGFFRAILLEHTLSSRSPGDPLPGLPAVTTTELTPVSR
jgi:hypothetical protein